MINIHTRSRIPILMRSLPRWAEVTPHDIPINLVVEPQEVEEHRDFLSDNDFGRFINIIRVPKRNMGMGNSRNVGAQEAWRLKFPSFITTDDDLYPRVDPTILLKAAVHRDIFGIGAYVGLYGMHMGIQPDTGIHRTSVGFRMWAMNTHKVGKVGGFPIEFKGYDDHEMARRGMKKLHLPWAVHSGVPIGSIGKIGDPGGMSSLPGMDNLYNRKHTAHVLSYQRWPDYVNDPDRCVGRQRCGYMMQWKRFMMDCGIQLDKEN